MRRSTTAAVRSVAAFVLALAVLSWLAAGPASASAPVPTAASASTVHQDDTYTICSDWAILPGYAVTAITTDSTCKYYESYPIRPSVDNLIVCNSTPVPSPFVVIRITSSGSAPCDGTTDLWTIYTVHEGTNACSGSPIPAGWSFTQITSSAGQCGTLTWDQVVVDALHDQAAALYQHFGFRRIPASLRLVQKVSSILASIERA